MNIRFQLDFPILRNKDFRNHNARSIQGICRPRTQLGTWDIDSSNRNADKFFIFYFILFYFIAFFFFFFFFAVFKFNW